MRTGCHNRRFFDEVERRELERYRRYGTPLSVVFIDVNHFKRLNDTLGHDRGDAVLWMIGDLLRGQVRQSDYAIRWGGDEFLLLLSCGEEEARSKAAALKATFDRERLGAALPDYLGLSVGVAPVSPEEGLRAAIREADSEMYGDKLTGSAGNSFAKDTERLTRGGRERPRVPGGICDTTRLVRSRLRDRRLSGHSINGAVRAGHGDRQGYRR